MRALNDQVEVDADHTALEKRNRALLEARVHVGLFERRCDERQSKGLAAYAGAIVSRSSSSSPKESTPNER